MACASEPTGLSCFDAWYHCYAKATVAITAWIIVHADGVKPASAMVGLPCYWKVDTLSTPWELVAPAEPGASVQIAE